ncbi:MAG: hypothetical protein E7231_17030 [Cellulosilyticum sp.]|nr:hypothetical protein [Cellulosilyticum sp.]
MKQLNIKDSSVIKLLSYIWIFFFSLTFQALNMNLILIVSMIFAMLYLLQNKEALNDWAFRFITVAGLIIAIIDFHAGVYDPLYFALIWPASYLIGRFMITGDDPDKEATIGLGVMTLGIFIQGILNYYNHNEGLEVDNGWGGWNEFWTGTFSSRTVYVFDFVFIAAWLIFALIIFKKNKLASIAIIVLNIIAFLCDFVFARGRLCITMQIVVTGSIGLLYLIKERKNITQRTRKIVICVAVVAVLALIVFSCAVKLDLFGLKGWYDNSFLSRDGGILGNVRYRSIVEGLVETVRHPEGGWNTASLGIAHNVFLLFAKEYDIFVFALLIGYEIVTVSNAIKLAVQKLSASDYLILACFLAVNLYFMIETCPWRYRNYWFFILFVGGIIKNKLEYKKILNDITQ